MCTPQNMVMRKRTRTARGELLEGTASGRCVAAKSAALFVVLGVGGYQLITESSRGVATPRLLMHRRWDHLPLDSR
jgi:hypothetical protein